MLNRVEIFLEVARLQSFAKAAQNLGMSGPAASKQVMALEAELGVKLLHRTTRLVTLTDEGSLYYERARLAIEELKEAALQISDMRATLKGTLRVSVPLSFGHMHLLPVLSGFAKKYPDLRMEISLDDRRVDVMADGFDLVIRVGVMEDSGIISRHLANCPMLLVASPEYLKKNGKPASPQELKNHRMITFAYHGAAHEWRYRDKNGKTGSVKTEGCFKANTAEMMLQSALDGNGIALLPNFSIAASLDAKKLVHILPAFETFPERKITALMPPNRYRAAKVKLLLDHLTESCKVMNI